MATKMLGGQPVSEGEYNKAVYGTRIPNVEQKRAFEAMQRGAMVEDEITKRGGSVPMDGLNESGQPVSTLGMTENEKFFAVGRMQDAQRRAEKQQAPLKQFEQDINTSVAFGEESNLLNEAGRKRAMKQGVAAGLSYQEADAAVQGAFDFLSKKYGKKDATPDTTPSVGVPPLLARPEEGSATPPTPTVQPENKPPEQRDTSPDNSASASHRARLRGRAAEGKPTEVQPDNMGKPTGPPTPSSAIPVKTSLGTVWTDSSGYTYPYKPAPINPEDYTSGAELLDMVGLPQAWSNLKSGISSSIGGFSEEYKKAQGESPDTPLRSAAKGAWEFLKRAYPKTDWTKLQ